MTYMTVYGQTQNPFRFYNTQFPYQIGASKPRNYNLKPSADIAESDEGFDVQVELPGVSKEDLMISVTDHLLTIKGEKRKAEDENSKDFRMIERRFGSFERKFTLPSGVTAENITADIKDGVLSLSIPKPEESKPKEIPVATESQ